MSPHMYASFHYKLITLNRKYVLLGYLRIETKLPVLFLDNDFEMHLL